MQTEIRYLIRIVLLTISYIGERLSERDSQSKTSILFVAYTGYTV